MKKAKSSNYKKVDKYQKKTAEKASADARAAMRELYTDAAFQKDFDLVLASTKDRLLGKDKVDHMAIIRYFPDKSTTVMFPAFSLNDPGRRNAYQELGINLGTQGLQMVSLHSWELIMDSAGTEAVMVSSISVDGRKLFRAFLPVRDSKGVIQNVSDYECHNIHPVIGLQHDDFIAGYGYGLRDNMLRKMMGTKPEIK